MSENPHTISAARNSPYEADPARPERRAALLLAAGLFGLLAMIVGLGLACGGAWLDRLAATEPTEPARASARRLEEGKPLLGTPQQSD
jgi:hypothetical protein